MTPSLSAAPEFERPPVTRAVLSLIHEPLSDVAGAHMGAFWATLRDDYPSVVEFIADPAQIERFDDTATPELDVDVDYGEQRLAAPRVVLVGADRSIQLALQSDTFELSWHKDRSGSGAYPRFATLLDRFIANLESWRSFLGEHSIGSIHARQTSFNYLNEVARGDDWQTTEDLTKIFRMPAPREHAGKLEVFHYADHTRVTDDMGGQRRVHLNFFADPVEGESASAVLSITCRGPVTGPGDDIAGDLRTCHDHAFDAFVSATTPHAQQMWGRIES
jgi:uncharacterized protein (TIGR04255 family)